MVSLKEISSVGKLMDGEILHERLKAQLMPRGENDSLEFLLSSTFNLEISSSFSVVSCSICFRSFRMTPLACEKISSCSRHAKVIKTYDKRKSIFSRFWHFLSTTVSWVD